MALKIRKYESNATYTLPKFVSFIEDNLDFSCDDSVEKCMAYLGNLHNNRSFLSEYLVSSISKGLKDFESHNRYNPPSIILADSEKFIIRANLWRPTESYKKGDINVYGLGHDHNFNFITLNYWGPGYCSEMYEYDYQEVEGYPGEACQLTSNGVMNLNEGEIYFYRKNKDVHRQLPPKSATITINIMEKIDSINHTKQYIFDLDKSIIDSVYGDFYSKKYIYEMALLTNDESIYSLLKEIYQKTDCKLTREFLDRKFSQEPNKSKHPDSVNAAGV